MTTTDLPHLSRSIHGRPAAPVRIVHLGLGNFTRAHQAWYTDRAPDAERWGIAAFTGRRPDQANALAPQDGLFTLVTGGPEGDEYQVISSVSAVHPASDHNAFLHYLRSPDVSIITTTVTEAGYKRADNGHLDATDDAVAADAEGLRDDAGYRPTTVPGRIVAGLRERRAAGAGRITILPCDNLPGNGEAIAMVVRDMARKAQPDLLDWITTHVSFATSMVDRITPATTDELRERVASAQGYQDASPVPTEPFSEWVISGDFPAGRPAWEQAGAQVVADVEPFEERKLWLLNGAHSLMAYAATIVGHQEVREAIEDPVVRGWVDQWWDVAAAHLNLPEQENDAYRAALLDRFANPQVHHLLAQIAGDGSQKIPVRIFPVLRAERQEGTLPKGAVRPLAAWILHLLGHGAPLNDERGRALAGQVVGKDPGEAARVVLDALGAFPGDEELIAAIAEQANEVLEHAKP